MEKVIFIFLSLWSLQVEGSIKGEPEISKRANLGSNTAKTDGVSRKTKRNSNVSRQIG